MKKNKNNPSADLPTLDLHGYLVDEVFDAIDAFLRKSESQNHSRVRIITGKGTGKVRAKTLEYLKIAQYDPKSENEGSFVIVL